MPIQPTPSQDSRFSAIRFSAMEAVAAGLGFEPRLTAPKTAVLPLDDPAKPRGTIPEQTLPDSGPGIHAFDNRID